MTTAPAAPAAPVTSGGPAGAVRAPLGPADVAAAAARIAGHVRRTPLLPGLPAPDLHRTGRRLLLKAEHLQYGGSFKLRGAANAVLALGARRIVTGSSGNHGIALARLAAALGAEVTVVLAGGAHPAKIALIRALGGRTLGVPGGVAERDARARALAEETGAVLVPSSDHELVVAGQGTVGLEILAEVPDAETVYVPTGGGGLLAGVCLAAYGHPVRVVGVEPAGSPATPGPWPRGTPYGWRPVTPSPTGCAASSRGRCRIRSSGTGSTTWSPCPTRRSSPRPRCCGGAGSRPSRPARSRWPGRCGRVAGAAAPSPSSPAATPRRP